MPVYAYRCQDCGHAFEAKQSFNDDPITVCPECGHAQSVIRVIQPAGVVFKGSGWYVTDTRSSRESLTTKPTTTGAEASTSTNGTGKSKDGAPKSETKQSAPTTSAAD